MATSCDIYSDRKSFPAYVQLLLRNNFQDLDTCRAEICSALWGSGNPDIAGIGVCCVLMNELKSADALQVITAYIMQLALGIAFCALLLFVRVERHPIASRCLRSSFPVFVDAAMIFTFSVQLASLILMARKDFGISADNLGGYTMEITWTAALLTMLPATMVVFFKAENEQDERDSGEKSSRTKKHRTLSLSIVCLSWCFFLYTFLSRMIAAYGPSQIGTAVSDDDWAKIQNKCFEAYEDLTASTRNVMQGFAIAGSLFVSMLVLGKLLGPLFTNVIQKSSKAIGRGHVPASMRIALITLTLLLGVPQVWAIFVLRLQEQRYSQSIGVLDSVNGWGFGQIVAVVVFSPVLIDFVYTYLESNNNEESRL